MIDFNVLRNELSAPIKTIRIFAIENVLKTGCTNKLLECLKEFAAKETDTECIMLFNHAIEQVSARVENKSVAKVSVEQILAQITSLSAAEQLKMISGIKVTQLRKLDHQTVIANFLQAAKDAVVASIIVKKFRKYWPESYVSFLEKNVFAKTKSLQIACIETLILHYPNSLKSKLTKLIFINDPVIRSLAIRGMAKHFPILAAEFIHECFTKGDSYNKLTALKICSTFKFSLIKESLFGLMENDPDMTMFDHSMTVILANPDREVPLRLIEMMGKLSEEKVAVIRKILPEYCKIIQISEICEDFNSYIAYLNEYPKILNAKHLLARAIASYLKEDENSKQAISDFLKPKLSDKYLVQAVKKFISTTKNNELKIILESLFEEEEIVSVEPDLKKETQNLSNKELLKKFSLTKFKKSPEIAELIKPVLDSSESSPALKCAAIKAAGNLEICDYEKLAQSWIKDQNETLVAAAIDYLSNFDQDKFQLLVQKFLNTDSHLIRITIIKVTAKKIPDRAKFLIKHMLSNSKPELRKHGLEAFVHLDFFDLFHELIKYLESETEPDLMQDGLSILLTNPCLESVFQLKLLENKNKSYLLEFSKASDELKKVLTESGIASAVEIETYVENKISELKKQSSQIKKEKQLKAELEDLKEKLNWNSITGSLEELEINWKKWIGLFVFFFVLFNILNYLIFGGDVKSDKKELRLKPVLATKTNYEVVIDKCMPKNLKIIARNASDKNEVLILTFSKDSYIFLQFLGKGDKLTVVGNPYKRNSKGNLFIKVKKFQAKVSDKK